MLTFLMALAVLTATPATLPGQLAAAAPGDTVTLAPGAYGRVTVPAKTYALPLTINAAGATIAGLRIDKADGVIWRGGTISAPGGYGTIKAPPKGDDGYAVTALASKHVRIEGITATNARLGVLIGGSSDVVLAGSTITGVGEDGLRATYNERLTVVGNKFVDFAPVYTGAHPDAAQMYANKGLVFAYNTISGTMQGGDDFGGNTDPFNDGVVVIGNSVRVFGYFHGLTFESSTNVTLIGNDVGALPGWARTVTIRAPAGAMQCGNTGMVSATAKRPC